DRRGVRAAASMCVSMTVPRSPYGGGRCRPRLSNDLQRSCVSSAHLAQIGSCPVEEQSIPTQTFSIGSSSSSGILRLDLGRIALCPWAVRIRLPVGLSRRGIPDRSRSGVAGPRRRSRAELYFAFADFLHEIGNKQRRDECKDHHNPNAELECSHQSPPLFLRATHVPR